MLDKPSHWMWCLNSLAYDVLNTTDYNNGQVPFKHQNFCLGDSKQSLEKPEFLEEDSVNYRWVRHGKGLSSNNY